MKNLFWTLLIMLVAFTQTKAGFINGTMTHQNKVRKYVIYVPSLYYSQNKKVPLLIGLHGFGDDIANFSQICMSNIADTANYIVAYPEALADPVLGANAWNSGAGALGIIVNNTIDDVGFITRLMDTIISKYSIDTTRMYMFGFSFGGFMTNRMACEKSSRLAAVASVSGLKGNYVTATPQVPMPYMHFHGTADQTIGYYGTSTMGFLPGLGLSAENTTKYWANHNHCNMTPIVDSMPNLKNDGLRFVRFSYLGGDNGSTAILYKVMNGEHKWYGTPTNDISYCQTIWSFFSQYSRTATITAIRNNSSKTSIKIFPNPSSGSISIQSEAAVNSVQIWNMEGKMIVEDKIDNQRAFTLSKDLSNGAYIVRLLNNKNETLGEEKLLIQH
ncbi:MAG TPA: T9SS type A sorting domain-containing protein [Chitinophagales bacterium]|nr:T9SS type A sorting domain-containing protein [Chitinophagales bacterium]